MLSRNSNPIESEVDNVTVVHPCAERLYRWKGIMSGSSTSHNSGSLGGNRGGPFGASYDSWSFLSSPLFVESALAEFKDPLEVPFVDLARDSTLRDLRRTL